jgi:protein-tyrosine-phosphatase
MEEKRVSTHKTPHVLFICTANICRSPMAQAILLDLLKKEHLDSPDWQVESAGTWALDGKPASKNSELVMSRRGLDVRGHRSRTVTAEMIADSDLVLTMEAVHKEALQQEFPWAAGRIFLLTEMAGETESVDDPYGGPVKEYEKTARLLEEIIEKGMPQIIRLVGS